MRIIAYIMNAAIPTFSHKHKPFFPSFYHFPRFYNQGLMTATYIGSLENFTPYCLTCVVYYTFRVLLWFSTKPTCREENFPITSS